eukprot:496306_1
MANRGASLVGFAVFLCIITQYACPSFPFLPLLPICGALAKGIGGERKIDGWMCGFIFSCYYAVLSYPISMLLYVIPYHWCLLTAYSFFLLVYNRHVLGINTEQLDQKVWFQIWLAIFWDPPLLLAWNIVSISGGQLSAPLISIIDKNICIGALPCSKKNVLKLYGDPYHIRAVICMCNESTGPKKEYEKYKIKYVQLNTLDTTPPSIGNIHLGIKFIEQFIKWRDTENNNLGRIFIHCKGGRGRAVTMALCWFLSQGMKATDAMHLIKSQRAVASRVVITYNTVKHFIKKFEK